ncbi:Dyp-type peroxidase [Streptomyces sp. NPDC003480]
MAGHPRNPVPQPVLSPLTTAAIFLVTTIDPRGEPAVRDVLADLNGLQRAVGFRAEPDGRLSCVVGIGSQAWDRLFAGPRPAELHPFRELSGPVHRAVSTPGDLLFHIRAARLDLCFALAAEIMERLRDAVTVRDEVHGFKYFDVRDLLGFVDGTENPRGPAAHAAVLIEDEDPAFAGGSYVIVQKYLHDLDAWNALPVEAQELVVGRRKLSDVELDDEVKPADSHVALNTIVDPDGTKHEILRDNMPFGTVGKGKFGTYFIGYARTPTVTERMLERMFLGAPPATHDRILDFSTAVTGSLFYVPTSDFLDDLPDPPGATVSGEAGTPHEASGPPAYEAEAARDEGDEGSDTVPPVPVRVRDGSLGIGDLKGSHETQR